MVLGHNKKLKIQFHKLTDKNKRNCGCTNLIDVMQWNNLWFYYIVAKKKFK